MSESGPERKELVPGYWVFTMPQATIEILRSCGKMCGSDIGKAVENRTGRRPGKSQIYPVLKLLLDQGLIVECAHDQEKPTRRGRPQIVFKLTRAGEEAAVSIRSTVASLYGLE